MAFQKSRRQGVWSGKGKPELELAATSWCQAASRHVGLSARNSSVWHYGLWERKTSRGQVLRAGEGVYGEETHLSSRQSTPSHKRSETQVKGKDMDISWGRLGLQQRVGFCISSISWKFNLEFSMLGSQASLNHLRGPSFQSGKHACFTICPIIYPLLQHQYPPLTFWIGAFNILFPLYW